MQIFFDGADGLLPLPLPSWMPQVTVLLALQAHSSLLHRHSYWTADTSISLTQNFLRIHVSIKPP
jgi:hypothetical protein